MQSTTELLAKSPHYGAVPLRDHLQSVADAARQFAPHFGLEAEVAYCGGLLHDIGKAHPFFQARLQGQPLSLAERSRWGTHPPFRHEIASLFFLPFLSEAQWPALTEMIAAHHKSIEGDPRARGLLDLDNEVRNFEALHLGEWYDWAPRAEALLAQFGFERQNLTVEQAQATLTWAIEYCEAQPLGWSPWRGLLMAADHFVSALDERAEAFRAQLFQVPDTSAFDQRSSLFPLSEMAVDQPAAHTLLVAPTGAGKTNYLLRRCQGRLLYVLPFQASINAMHDRLQNAMPATDIRLLHAASRLVAAQRDQQATAELQPHVGAAAKVLTPYQLASTVLGGMGFEAQLLDLHDTDVILDEIHTYGEGAQAFVFALVERLAQHGCRIHIGTATMPSALYNKLKDLLEDQGGVAEVHLAPEQLATYDRHTVHKAPADEDAVARALAAAQEGEKVLAVCNTVPKAQALYEELSQRQDDGPAVMLVHSRFRRRDRNALEQKLMELERGKTGCIVVSTQVVEVSLDISFDRMITEAAPLDSLIQRFGRVNRRRTPDQIGRLRPVHVLAPGDKTLPYDQATVAASYEALPDGAPLRANDLQAMLDAVYPTLNLQRIDTHVKWRDGACTLKRLTHIHQPVLQSILAIDSVLCIRQADEVAYREADWMSRVELEIPVAGKSFYPYRDQFARLEGVGNEPYLIPSELYGEAMGLVLRQPDNQLG